MKLTLLFLFCTLTVVSQREDRRNAVERNNYTKIFSRGESFTFDGTTKLSKGPLYLNKGWKSRSVIITKSGEKLSFKNLNFNVDTQIFESKYSEEDSYKIAFDEIDYIFMNNKKYQELDYKGQKQVFEFLYESSDILILKTYFLNVKAASSNPMVNRKKNIYSIRNNFYSVVNGKWDEISLTRKQILKILESRSISIDDVEKFVDSNNLKYKKEFDLKIILNHFL